MSDYKYRPRRGLGDPITVARLLVALIILVIVGAIYLVLRYAH